jgi:hypothetical protein
MSDKVIDLAELRGEAREADEATGKTYALLTIDDLAALPPMRWRVKGVLPETGVAAIFGPPGAGKSFLSLDLAGAIGAGRDWFGHRVNAAPVAYLGLEGESGLRNRVAAYRTHHGGDSLADVRFILEAFNLLTDDPVALARSIQAAGMEKPVVIIDTLNRASPGADENSSSDMGRIIAAAKEIQNAVDGLVILVHHSGKNDTKGLRGHSSLLGALDAVISVRRDGDIRKWSTAQEAGGKVKDGADGADFSFTLQVYSLGYDEDGDPVTSCAVAPDMRDPGALAREKAPLGKHGKAALEILNDMFERRRSNLMESGKDPAGARVSLTEWCNELRDLGAMPKNRAYEGRTEAIRKGYVFLMSGFVDLVPVVPTGTDAGTNSGTETGMKLVPEAPPVPNKTAQHQAERRSRPLNGEVIDLLGTGGTSSVPVGTGTTAGTPYRTGTAPPLGGGTVPGTGTGEVVSCWDCASWNGQCYRGLEVLDPAVKKACVEFEAKNPGIDDVEVF